MATEKETIATLTKELATANADLTTANEQLSTANASLTEALQLNAQYVAQIEALELALEQGGGKAVVTAPKPQLPVKSFTVDGKKYNFTIPRFYYNGVPVNAEEVIKDKEICAALVAMGFGGIEPAFD